MSSATADRAGLFEAAAHFDANAARGSQQRLLISLFAVGALVTAVLSNDATALLLTPLAFAATARLGLNPRPYVFACALVANAATFLMPVSNPANLRLALPDQVTSRWGAKSTWRAPVPTSFRDSPVADW